MSWIVTLIGCGALPLGVGGADLVAPSAGATIERWPDGTPRAEGATDHGVPTGTWTWWAEDGSFRARATFVDGVAHGPRLEVGHDGRLVELTLDHGILVGWRTLPADAPAPEWEGGRRVEGTRYRGIRPSP